MSLEDCAPLIAHMQHYLGMFYWLALGTRPDITTTVSFLAQYQQKPSPGHLDAVKYLGRSLKALEAFLHFPIPSLDPAGSFLPHVFCDANWGPQDASSRNINDAVIGREVSLEETRSVCGHV
jgi:hypothetical protein